MLTLMSPPLGLGKRCPSKVAYKVDHRFLRSGLATNRQWGSAAGRPGCGAEAGLGRRRRANRGDELEGQEGPWKGAAPRGHSGCSAALLTVGFVLCYLCLTASAWLPVSGFRRGERGVVCLLVRGGRVVAYRTPPHTAVRADKS